MAAGYFFPQTSLSFPYNLGQNFDFSNLISGNYSLISVNLGRSSNPEVEDEILKVASYGKQLGRIEDALELVIDHLLHGNALTERDDAIKAFRALLYDIGDAKKTALAKAA